MKSKLLNKKVSNDDWGWYGSHLDIIINEIKNTQAASFSLKEPRGKSITLHDMDLFIKKLKKLYSEAEKKHINLDVKENMEIEGLEETKGLKSQSATEETLGKISFRILEDSDKAWGWSSSDINLGIILPEPENTNEGAIEIISPNSSLTINGLSAFLILLNKAAKLAENKNLEIMNASDYNVMSQSDKDMFKNMGIKARKK